ncbi:MAG: TdeIII family type II restriction endonuclease [Pseudanabaena sp. ELA645]|jgi:hypothetical protein
MSNNCHLGSAFDDFLEQEGILNEVTEVALKRVLAWQVEQAMLIGDEFWDQIGGEGTYNNFIQEANSLGKDYRERIYREFLGIEPPPDFDEYLLK